MPAHPTPSPPWRRLGLVAAALLALCGAASCAAPRREVGRQCVFNDDCADGLICAGTYCRRPCTTDRDCPNNGVCRSTGERDLLGCFDRGAPQLCVYASDCPAGTVCTIDGTCGPECTEERDCELRVGRTHCDTSRGACVAPAADAGSDGPIPRTDGAADTSADGAGS